MPLGFPCVLLTPAQLNISLDAVVPVVKFQSFIIQLPLVLFFFFKFVPYLFGNCIYKGPFT